MVIVQRERERERERERINKNKEMINKKKYIYLTEVVKE